MSRDSSYILELIGKGGSAIVYKARDIHNGGIYALKKYITSDPANRKKIIGRNGKRT